MTEEEMVKDYVQTECCNSCTDSCKKNKCKMYCNVRNAVLYGLKAGKDMAEADLATIAYMHGAERYKTKWHKVADGDYPSCDKGNYTINVLTDRGEIAYYDYDEGCWVAEPTNVEIDPPVAWCKIPKYKE